MTEKNVDIRQIYENNQDFHDYVHNYIRKNGKTVETALREKIVQEVAIYYNEKGDDDER